MWETIGTGLFALIVLSIWSNSDVKTGYVHNAALLIPVFFAAVMNLMRFATVFMPVFLLLAGMFFLVKKKGLLGFADVVGLPFVLLFLIDISVFGIAAFTIVFAVLVLKKSNEKFDKKLKQNVYNRIILMPILLLSYFAGFAVHWLAVLIF